MDKWVLYGKTGNPASDIAKAWLKNNGIPSTNYSIFQITKEEIVQLADLLPDGAKDLVYPTTFSFSLINPQKKTELEYIEKIHNGEFAEEEIRNLLTTYPALIISPIITNGQTVLIGYDIEKLVSTFRFVKVKDITTA
ncbi:ArsC/Spx/MgsR family protein [Bacillus sp. B15-48]|uniref:arsenate reductase family protein n=1 Tax=Bacillus sp. B15-48 TaxID=1548601 RepID=UPI0019400FA9|nr:ArsC/Spx/MgsR family protein [Bacillus sp. B15-48]